jgi:hypothetical protein
VQPAVQRRVYRAALLRQSILAQGAKAEPDLKNTTASFDFQNKSGLRAFRAVSSELLPSKHFHCVS